MPLYNCPLQLIRQQIERQEDHADRKAEDTVEF